MANLTEGFLAKINAWAENMKKSGGGNKKQASALASFMGDAQMQNKMQEVAVDQLVQSFSQALASIKDANAKQNAVEQFWSTWKDKTNQTILSNVMKKYKLIPRKS